MNLRKNTADISQKRMLSEKEAQAYLGLGRTKTRELCKEINAVTHIGTRVLYDKVILDKFLDQIRGQQLPADIKARMTTHLKSQTTITGYVQTQ